MILRDLSNVSLNIASAFGVSVNEYERIFANIQASCSIIFSLQNNNNTFEKGHKLLCKKTNLFIY